MQVLCNTEIACLHDFSKYEYDCMVILPTFFKESGKYTVASTVAIRDHKVHGDFCSKHLMLLKCLCNEK